MKENEKEEKKQKELDREDSRNGQIREMGQVVLDGNSRKHKVELLTVISCSFSFASTYNYIM